MSDTNPSNALEQRVEELETKAMFQDDLIEQLNTALINQQNDLSKLMRLVENMASQIDRLNEPNSNNPPIEIPPHY